MSIAPVTSPVVSPTETEPEKLSIVYFDGVCGMCNWFVNFLMSIDRAGRLRFAPLQGETAAQHLRPEDIQNLDTVVFESLGMRWRHSSAVIRIWWTVGGFWSVLASLLWIVPRPLRDWGYRCIARNRYRLFGKKETCRLPTPEERSRFLP